MISLVGFAPDLPPETPGVFTDCKNILPAVGGFVSANTPVDANLGALDGAAKGFAVTRKIDNAMRVFSGSSAKLYEATAGVWADISKSGGYTLGPDDRWRFAQFGNVTIAAAKSVTIQSISGGAAFADLSASAPKAEIVETINNQVFAFNINGMGFGDSPERWACSAVGDETDWTPSVSTQCVSGQLLDTPGPITAGKRLGDIIVAYKDRSMYVGQYVGVPLVWDFRKLPGEIGTPCNEAVVSTGTMHFFIGHDDFYVFDGTRPQPLNAPLRNWFFATVDPVYMYKICGTYDRFNQRVFWWFPSSSSSAGALDKCVVYNIKTNQWGRMDGSIEIAAEYVASGVTYAGLGTLYSTYDDLPTNISYNSPFWTSGAAVLAAFGTDHKAYQYSGVPTESRFTTGHYGDNTQFSTVTRIRPRFIQSPTSSTLNYSYSNTDASAFASKSTSTYSGNWYNFIWSARWHRFEFVFNGPTKISGFDLFTATDGIE